ncbi:hypothetical protein WH7805_10583 [Synechococcus sp. WH 7805]|nr:hypothetical protein WH7805_10583 [Synechococcus sp. WH 7805]
MFMSIHIRQIIFLAFKNMAMAKSGNQFIKVTLPAKASILHVVNSLLISNNHPQVRTFTPMNGGFFP